MRLIDRYLFLQLLVPTLQASLALAGVAMISEALTSLGLILNQHQSVLVFLQVVLLASPQLIVLILPVAVFVATLITFNRLRRDNEITVCFAAGMSRWRVISAGARLAALVGLTSLAINLWLQPLCYRQMRDTLERARTDVVAALVREGQFTHPAPGVTVFAQAVDPSGELRNVFIDQRDEAGRDTTITAAAARFHVQAGAPTLVLTNGQNAQLTARGDLNVLSFDRYALDLRALAPPASVVRYKLSDRYLHELFAPDLRFAWERANVAALAAEGHARLATPLWPLAFALLGMAAIAGGAFNRFGYGLRMAAASVCALLARLIGFAMQSGAARTPALNTLQYLTPVLMIAVCLVILLSASARTRRGNLQFAPLARRGAAA